VNADPDQNVTNLFPGLLRSRQSGTRVQARRRLDFKTSQFHQPRIRIRIWTGRSEQRQGGAHPAAHQQAPRAEGGLPQSLHPGANVIKLFFFLIDEVPKQAGVFVPGRHFKPYCLQVLQELKDVAL
jgi:hypothetical protein